MLFHTLHKNKYEIIIIMTILRIFLDFSLEWFIETTETTRTTGTRRGTSRRRYLVNTEYSYKAAHLVSQAAETVFRSFSVALIKPFQERLYHCDAPNETCSTNIYIVSVLIKIGIRSAAFDLHND